MKALFFSLIFFSVTNAFSATPNECLNGNFASCREVFNNFGSQTDRSGAVTLFEKACSSQALRVSCQITTTGKADTTKKTLDLAKPDSGMFVINGTKLDKIYQISEVK